MAQMGLPVSAGEAKIKLFDEIYHFSKKRSLDAGAFESFLNVFIPIVTTDSEKLVLLDELEGIVQSGSIDGLQLIGLLIHEVVQGAVIIGILHLLALNERGGELGGGVEAGLGDSAGDDVLHLHTDKRRALTGLDVLELHDLHNLTVHIKGNAVSKFACRNHFLFPPMMPSLGKANCVCKNFTHVL
jgi:hypothetical protein